MRKRTFWKVEECVALAKAWISVVEDPYVSTNQVIDRMWYRISQSYLKWKQANEKAHDAEQCRKQWERLRKQLSRFAGLYQKNLRLATSGMTTEDVKLLSHQQFPDSEMGFGEFKYWDVYLEVENSPKFMAGVEVGWTPLASTTAVSVHTNSPKLRLSSRHLNRLPAAVARLGIRPRIGWLGVVPVPRKRSNRKFLRRSLPS